ncbi:hypothetical protein MMA231_02469 [Asticcacaulis sp. MM231]
MLARVANVGSHHRSALQVKHNLLCETFLPSQILTRAEFSKWAMDFLIMANGYLERVDNIVGRPAMLKSSLAMNTRRGLKDGQYWFINNRFEEHEFKQGSVFHLMEHDISQEIYGVPQYLCMLQSAFLNEAATLFRRRYYLNGAHAGFVFYLSEASMQEKDVNNIREQLKKAKGVGNFKNLFMHSPGGKKDGVQIIPISAVAAKDEFVDIKNTTRDDVLAAHRVPPQLLGVIPQTAGGFGDVEKAERAFVRMEIKPLQKRFLELNDWLGFEAVRFADYNPESGAGA